MNEILAEIVAHGEILLFFYVLADQLGVPVPAAPVLIAAGGLAGAGRLSRLRRGPCRNRLLLPGTGYG